MVVRVPLVTPVNYACVVRKEQLCVLSVEAALLHLSVCVCDKAVLLENSHLLAVSAQRNGICEVLYAAAWICGEFSE